MKNILLDTNAYSMLMKGDKQVEQVLNHAEKVFLPLFVIAELLIGFKNGTKEQENRSILQAFEAMRTVERFYPTDETSEIFTDLFLSLKKAGRPIPVHDIWIAASAIETGSVLISYDNHFKAIEKVRVWDKL